jgi:hypothetical protein
MYYHWNIKILYSYFFKNLITKTYDNIVYLVFMFLIIVYNNPTIN